MVGVIALIPPLNNSTSNQFTTLPISIRIGYVSHAMVLLRIIHKRLYGGYTVDEASVPTSRAPLATGRLLDSRVVIGVRRPCRNPSVTQPRFEAADQAAESRLLVRLHGQKFQSELLSA